MFEEFSEYEEEILKQRGYLIVEGIARKSYDRCWESIKKIEGKIYHEGKDPYGTQINANYPDIQKWLEAQN